MKFRTYFYLFPLLSLMLAGCQTPKAGQWGNHGYWNGTHLEYWQGDVIMSKPIAPHLKDAHQKCQALGLGFNEAFLADETIDMIGNKFAYFGCRNNNKVAANKSEQGYWNGTQLEYRLGTVDDSVHFTTFLADADKKCLSLGFVGHAVLDGQIIDKNGNKIAYLRCQSQQTASKNKTTKAQSLNNDTQKPLITILSSSADDRRGKFVGRASDNIAVAEVRVDGAVVPLKSGGSFEWQGFVPAGGKLLTIEAIDTAGLSTTQRVRLERGQQNKASGPLFAELDPFKGKAAKKNRNALALIVGVSDYKRTSDPAIYADRDAQYFQDYAALKLGIPDNQIFLLVNDNADKVEITKAVKSWLLRMSVKDKTDVYVFFAGHGLASSDGSTMFLLPYDGDPELLEDSAIDRKQLFADIQAISPRSVTVFLDSFYSGGTRAGGTLVASLRPMTLLVQKQDVPDGFTILSAAKGDQTSQSLEEAKHGLFSYFLMRGLEGDADANNDNQITAGELHSFVTDKVERQSGFKQTPDLQGDGGRVLVRFE